LSSIRNVRIRGKIPREEWPKIAERFGKGESLAEIARGYNCTAPAIRYIVQRTQGDETKRDNRGHAVAPLRSDGGGRATAQVVSVESRVQASRRSANEIWNRVSSDIASFLAGMDAISMNESDENYEALLLATDRLLRSSARTRLEIERVLESRKIGTRRRAP
jgi:hypothetical protein